MSTSPPPFGPPGVPTQGALTPPAPPSWQVTGPPGTEPTSRRSRKVPIIVGALVVVVAVVVAVLVIGKKDGTSTAAVGFDARAARREARKIVDGATVGDDGYSFLSECPFGDVQVLYKAITKVVEVDSAVRDGDEQDVVKQMEGKPEVVSCDLAATDPTEVTKGPAELYFETTVDPPANYRRYVDDLATGGQSVKLEDILQYAGGMVYRFCWNPKSTLPACEADWVDSADRLTATVYLGGGQMTADDAFTALKAVLPVMGANLAKSHDDLTSSDTLAS